VYFPSFRKVLLVSVFRFRVYQSEVIAHFRLNLLKISISYCFRRYFVSFLFVALKVKYANCNQSVNPYLNYMQILFA